jgi:DNA-binding NarL/FixJ family response regulator
MTRLGVLLVVEQRPLADELERGLQVHPRFRPVPIDLTDPVAEKPAALAAAAIVELPDDETERMSWPFQLREVWPELRILALAHRPELPLLREAFRSGINALTDIRTPPDGVLRLLACTQVDQFVVEGDTALSIADRARASLRPPGPGRGPALTPREREVLELLGRGYDTASIAERLGLSVHTARGHVKRVMRKLRARSQLQAVLNASELGLLPRLEHVRHDPPGGW